MKFVYLALLTLLLVACATTKPPETLEELQRLMGNSQVVALKTTDPAAHKEMDQYIEQSEQAVAEGDTAKANHLALLGIITAKTACAAQEREAAQKRYLTANSKLKEKEQDLEQAQAALDAIETDLERVGLRRHLETVINETRLRAAAEEELLEKKPSNEKGEAVQQAERIVGQEMLSRAVVWSDIINIWSVTCASPESVKRPIEASLKLATKHLEQKDLASLQEQVELIGLEARRLYRDPWELKREEKKKLVDNIYKQLESEGFKITDEEFGPAVRFTTQIKMKDAPNEEWKQELKKLGTILARLQDLNYVVFVSAGTADRPLTAEKWSTKIANAVKKELVTAGVAEQGILASGLGAAKPLKSLRGGSVNAAILLVPLGTCK